MFSSFPLSLSLSLYSLFSVLNAPHTSRSIHGCCVAEQHWAACCCHWHYSNEIRLLYTRRRRKKNGHATVPVKTLCCTLSSIYLLDVYLLYYINNIRVGKKFWFFFFFFRVVVDAQKGWTHDSSAESSTVTNSSQSREKGWRWGHQRTNKQKRRRRIRKWNGRVGLQYVFFDELLCVHNSYVSNVSKRLIKKSKERNAANKPKKYFVLFLIFFKNSGWPEKCYLTYANIIYTIVHRILNIGIVRD